MGGFSHSFDFGLASTSRKLLTHKRYGDGLEAPRNSLELPVETSQGFHDIHENTLFSCQLKQNSSKRNFYLSGTSMKKLIDEEMSNGTNTRRSSPSLVARLMGMDMLPSDVKPVIHSKERQDGNSINSKMRKAHIQNTSTHYKPLGIMPFKQGKQNLLSYGSEGETNQSCKSSRLTKPQPREHPQEELLHKFKKEFEAWQSAKVWERLGAVGLGHSLQQGNDNQILARESLNREKMVLYEETDGSGSYYKGYMSKQGQSSPLEARSSGNKISSDFEQFPVVKFNEYNAKSSSPTRIVILKPSIENYDDIEESWPGSSEIVESEGSMEDFIEEVKERLRFEIQGKVAKDTRTIESMNEIPFSERLSDPKQIAQHIAKQIRESVTRDIGTMLMRSESSRSYRSEFKLNGPDSPELIQRDTRNFLSDRLKSVLQNKADVDITATKSGRSRPSASVEERVKLRPTTDLPKLGKKMSYWDDMKGVTKVKTGPFRKEQENKVEYGDQDMSPRNLVRSLSAPVPGTAFGKLLLEDQHVLAGAHIQRRHESIDKTSADVRKNKKDGFNFKGTVSNLRHNLSFRGKLFGKKMQSMPEFSEKESDSFNSIMTAPSVVLNLGIAQENFTEVPPSPASVCSSSHDELFKLSDLSPNSPLEAPFVEDHPSLLASRERFNLPVLQSLLDPLEIVGSEEVSTPEKSCDIETVDVEGHEEAYLRDILLTAGLYEGEPFDKTLTKCDVLTMPIADWVFERVEEAYSSKYGKMDGGESLLDSSKTVPSHKMIFDLLNEALPSMLRHPIPGSALKRFLSPTALPHGKKLLDDLWRQIQIYTHPSVVDESPSLDSLVDHDLRTMLWSETSHEDIDLVGGDIEWIILGELIDEFVLEWTHMQ